MPKTIIAWAVAVALLPAFAARADDAADIASKKTELRQQLQTIQQELDSLETPPPATATTTPAATQNNAGIALKEVVVTGTRPSVYDAPVGQTTMTIDRNDFKDATDASIGDVLNKTPGVTFVQANGPRDVSVSIRGSNARQTFGVRNIKLYEDGFPVTQPDGLGRTDLTDPHAYGSIDVYQGPSSALFGNYATGGAINFHTRSGGEIHGVEAAFDAGGYGYRNAYATVGHRDDNYEYALFASRVSGDGSTDHTGYMTTTLNFLATYAPTARDKYTFKFINNDLDADLSLRLSLDQYRANSYQKGCAAAATAAAGCATVSLFNNGFNNASGSTVMSPDEAGLGRNDRRTIAGARWEHALDARTTWRTQFVFDNRDIKQPTGTTSANGTYPSFNVMSDVTRNGTLFGVEVVHFIGIFWNEEDNNAATYRVSPNGVTAPDGKAKLGGLTQTVTGTHTNEGLNLREELKFDARWSATAGLGLEQTELKAVQNAYTYPTTSSPTTAVIAADRHFFNVAPEVALQYRPAQAWTLHARVASGYGTPQMTNLFVTPQGTPGNNTQLDPQTNIGIDLGADLHARTLEASLVVFDEFFKNELVTQSPGAGLLSYTYNAPRSEHRGVLASTEWRPEVLQGAYARFAYMFDDQRYTEYVEQISAGTQSTTFDRSGNKIPGVFPQTFTARFGYDRTDGALQGLGGYIESDTRDAYFIDNANSVKVPGYTLINLNLHYNDDLNGTYLKGAHFFFEIRNLFNKTYVASASNVTNTINATTGAQNPASSVEAATGSIYAGLPRAFFGGVRLKF